jgi:hypothetical protein
MTYVVSAYELVALVAGSLMLGAGVGCKILVWAILRSADKRARQAREEES